MHWWFLFMGAHDEHDFNRYRRYLGIAARYTRPRALWLFQCRVGVVTMSAVSAAIVVISVSPSAIRETSRACAWAVPVF